MKDITKKKLIYIRYILPPILLVVMLITMLIPSYRFISDGKANQPISAFSLLENSYEQSRVVLFGTDEQTNANILFSEILLVGIIAAVILFALALAVSVYCAVMALTYFAGDDEDKAEKMRALFITLLPNRIVASIGQALALPLLLVPYAMEPLYKYIFGMRVTFVLTAPDPLIFGGVALLAIFVLTIICAPLERGFDADIFKRNRLEVVAESEEEEEYESVFSTSDDNSDDDSLRERNERIRELLLKNKEN